MSELPILNQSTKTICDSEGRRVGPMTLQLVAGLEKIGLAMKSRSWRREGRAGLGPLQRQILSLLHAKPDQTAQVSTIANELVVRLPTASEAVATLERKRLVRRRRTMRDGRVVTVELTARGAKAASPTTGMPSQLTTAVGVLPEDEQVELLESLVKLIRALQQQGEISVARMCLSCRYFRPNLHSQSDHPHHCDYVDAPFGKADLRLECGEFEPASAAQARDTWAVFTGGRTAAS